MNKVGFISLGCHKNRLDSEVMLGLLKEAGYTLVPEEDAEILIVNTCGFIQEAKEEAIETTLEAARYKENASCRLLIMAGCFSQRYVNDLLQELPEVDYFIGLDDIPNIVEICTHLESARHDQKPSSPLSRQSKRLSRETPSIYLYDHQVPRLNLGHAHTAYVKIAEGCRYQCSFCAIPMIRGKLRSRSIESLVQEVTSLTDQGVQEVILIAQDTTSYGIDLTRRPMIAPLLERLVRIEKIQWIRLMYAYPTSLNLSLMKLVAREQKICTYIDLPLQHIDDTVLKQMRRGISEAKTRRLLEQLRQEIPGLTLRTSFITGFPGENDISFRRLEEFVREIQFERLGVFAYSHEEGTAAYDMRNQIPHEVAEARRDRLMEIQAEISLKKHQAMVGTIRTVLVDGVSEETPLLLESRTEGQAPEIDGVVYINKGHTEQGAFEQVLITEAFPYDIVGELV